MKASATSFRTTTSSGSASTPPPPDRFRLRGPTIPLDPRIHAYRRDIADLDLADRLFAPHYARAERRRCLRRAMLRAEPGPAAAATSELLPGEPFRLLDSAGGWAWGCCMLDGYVGYLPADALGVSSDPTHIVDTRGALLFTDADIKSPVLDEWPMGTRFAAAGTGDFLRTGTGYIHHRHARALALPEADPAAIAERLVGTPYRWGGRSGAGIDCSGLVQLALQLAGHRDVPRDSDLQRAALGQPLAEDAPLGRGDLVFFPGHVGLMADAVRLVHANAFWMAVTIEPLAAVIERLRPHHAEPVIARRRIEGRIA